MTRRRVSRTLAEQGGRIVCIACDGPVGVAGQPWKSNAALTVIPVHAMPGAPLAPQPQVVLRRFCCPTCGALLDTETAMPEDPFLDDVLEAQADEEARIGRA
jgi:acetone carboxylase gamma subunit